ncbi:MAG TPA: STAS/SEC14 domain-containing protein [Pelomicrobium sp.]|nr:STAS/SEC14 domain-containing protein [Pelomicrobium sp.]
MITIEHSDNLVNVAVLGEFALADYKEFEDNVLYKIEFGGKVNVLLDLRDMIRYTLDVAWEEIKFSRSHAHDFGRIAIVTNDQWLAWSAWVQRLFIEADIRVFDDYDTARAWAAAEATES